MLKLVASLIAVVVVVFFAGLLFHLSIPVVTALSVLGSVVAALFFVKQKGTNLWR